MSKASAGKAGDTPLAVDPSSGALYFHYLKFKVECLERSGIEFQSFFEEIMKKADPSFVAVKPSGQEGDWKNDGYSGSTETVFQVYAPEQLTAAQSVAKIREDFEGALEHWGDKMKGWAFVWSSKDALPPQVLNALLEIASAHTELDIDDWGREALWDVVEGLDEQARIELLGPVPVMNAEITRLVVQVTAAEVQALLTFVAEQEVGSSDGDLSLTALGEKMDRNDFSAPVRAVINGGLPLLATVSGYVDKHPDDRYSERVSASLATHYEALRETFDSDSDAIFFALIDRVAPEATPDERSYWAAVAIIDHYFELCEIFES